MTHPMVAPEPQVDCPADAIAAMCARLVPVKSQPLPLSRTMGRVLAEPLCADRPSPACDVSAMDGYAIRIDDLQAGRLTVAGEVRTGHAPPPMPEHAALRIFTGGPVPAEAQAVIPREQLTEHADAIELPAGLIVKPGQHIRRCGENGQADERIVDAGVAIDAVIAAALAAFGVTRAMVFEPVRVAAIVTGDEVHQAGAAVEPWQLRDSNGPVLEAMFAGMPWIDWLGVRYTRDDEASLGAAVRQALTDADALVLTGGVSMGDYDFVPQVLAGAGCAAVFHRLPIRPGKPVLGAIGPQGQAVLGLPGNPVSVMTTARRIAAPVLRYRAGFAVADPPVAAVELTNPDGKALSLRWSRPVRLIHTGQAELVSSRGSGDLISSARSDGFVEVPPDQHGSGPWPFYRWSLDR